MSPQTQNLDLRTTSQYWFCVDDLMALWHLSGKMVHTLLQPHRGRCHLARRGRQPRLVLWVPIEVVRTINNDRKAMWEKAGRETRQESSPAPDRRPGRGR